MRNIKFRAWGKTDSRMKDWKEILKCGFENILINNSFYELMQFTGLKDKNGKEIYEGDILKRYWKHDGSMNEGEDIFICELKNQRWLHRIDVEEWSDIFGNEEVIGNKFENPEILK